MAGGRIKGITIEIGGDTTKLQSALKGVDRQLHTTQNNLKDINKLLKLNPGNTELLTQKQKNLTEAINLTKERLNQLKEAQAGVEKGSAEWDALQREIIATEGDLKNLQQEMRNFGNVTGQQLKAVGGKLQAAGAKIEEVGHKLQVISGAAAAVGGGLLKLGYDAAKSADEMLTLSEQTGIPVWGTVGQQSVLDEFRRYAQDHDLDSAYIGRYQPIKVMMHRSWDKYLSEGL